MKKIEYYINILHYVIYKTCDKYKKILPDFPVDVNSGRFVGIFFILLATFFFMLFKSIIYPIEIRNEYIFVFLIPFGLLVYYTVLHQDKYLNYFKKFEEQSKQEKRKWAWISFITVLLIILLLILSFIVMTNNIHD